MSGPQHISNPFSIKLCGLEIHPFTVKRLELVSLLELLKNQNDIFVLSFRSLYWFSLHLHLHFLKRIHSFLLCRP